MMTSFAAGRTPMKGCDAVPNQYSGQMAWRRSLVVDRGPGEVKWTGRKLCPHRQKRSEAHGTEVHFRRWQVSGLVLRLAAYRLHLCGQHRQVNRDDAPDSMQVYAEVIVDQSVPESGDCSPFHLRMTSFHRIADLLSRFGQDLKIPQNAVLNQIGTAEGVLPALAISPYAANAIENMDYVE
jgi:hypothetical protein